jgi:hypothetical protein
MLTADGEAGDTPLRFFTKNTMPLWRLGLFSQSLSTELDKLMFESTMYKGQFEVPCGFAAAV